MYSGRISEFGTVVEAGARLVIEASKTTTGLSVGGSVSINGFALAWRLPLISVDELALHV